MTKLLDWRITGVQESRVTIASSRLQIAPCHGMACLDGPVRWLVGKLLASVSWCVSGEAASTVDKGLLMCPQNKGVRCGRLRPRLVRSLTGVKRAGHESHG